MTKYLDLAGAAYLTTKLKAWVELRLLNIKGEPGADSTVPGPPGPAGLVIIPVITGDEPRGDQEGGRIWAGGIVRPVNALDHDLWMSDQPIEPPTPATVTTLSMNSLVANSLFTQIFTAGGTGPFEWSATGLPTGVAMDPDTGTLSGTPTTALQSGTASILAMGPGGGSPKTFNWTVAAAGVAPSILVTPVPPAATLGEPYSWTPGRNGNTPQVWGVSAGVLPSGLGINSSTGVISGTSDATAGDYPITLESVNAFGSHTREFTISVSMPAAFASIWGETVPPGAYTLFNDGGGNLKLATAFYRTSAGGAFQIEGAKIYLDEGIPSLAGKLNVFYAVGFKNGATPAGPNAPEWGAIGALPAGQMAVIQNANLSVGWNEVEFATPTVIQPMPAGVDTNGFVDGTWVWIGYYFDDGNHYLHAPSPNDFPIFSPDLTGLVLAGTGFGDPPLDDGGRSANNAGGGHRTGSLYGIDILASDA